MADEAREVVPFQVFQPPLRPVGLGEHGVVTSTHQFDATREKVEHLPPVAGDPEKPSQSPPNTGPEPEHDEAGADPATPDDDDTKAPKGSPSRA